MVAFSEDETDWQSVIGRSLAFICLHLADSRDDGLAAQSKFLENLGLARADAARLLGTSEDSLRVMIARAEKKGAKGGRKTASKKRR